MDKKGFAKFPKGQRKAESHKNGQIFSKSGKLSYDLSAKNNMGYFQLEPMKIN